MSFRQLEDDDHHHGATPLCNLPINMIMAFPIDYMHLVCLGVIHHLILAWVHGKPGQARLGAQYSPSVTNLGVICSLHTQ